MACIARRSDCDSPGFPVESVNTTYPTQQQCMDARYASHCAAPCIIRMSVIVMSIVASAVDHLSHSAAVDLTKTLFNPM
ncbi:hypothetical protein COOONC_22207 [Cooperia oncophora]